MSQSIQLYMWVLRIVLESHPCLHLLALCDRPSWIWAPSSSVLNQDGGIIQTGRQPSHTLESDANQKSHSKLWGILFKE